MPESLYDSGDRREFASSARSQVAEREGEGVAFAPRFDEMVAVELVAQLSRTENAVLR